MVGLKRSILTGAHQQTKEEPGTMKKSHIASFALAGALFGSVATGTVAQRTTPDVVAVGQNGAAGLVAAVVDATVILNDVSVDVVVVDLSNSLNNLRALNNVLNNNDIDVTVQDISVLDGAVIQILNDNNIALDDVVGVAVLSGGDLIVFAA